MAFYPHPLMANHKTRSIATIVHSTKKPSAHNFVELHDTEFVDGLWSDFIHFRDTAPLQLPLLHFGKMSTKYDVMYGHS